VPFPGRSASTSADRAHRGAGVRLRRESARGRLFARLGEHDVSQRLAKEAARLRQRVIDAFWLEDAGTFALALDGDKNPVQTVTSNAGQLLWSRLPDTDRALRLATTLLRPTCLRLGHSHIERANPVFNR
jgi:glycogen debranching enzyme